MSCPSGWNVWFPPWWPYLQESSANWRGDIYIEKQATGVISRGHLFVEPFLSGSPVSCLQWCAQHPHGSVAMAFYLSTDRRVFCSEGDRQRLFCSVVPYACVLDCSGRFDVLWPPCSPFQQCRHLLIAAVCSQSSGTENCSLQYICFYVNLWITACTYKGSDDVRTRRVSFPPTSLGKIHITTDLMLQVCNHNAYFVYLTPLWCPSLIFCHFEKSDHAPYFRVIYIVCILTVSVLITSIYMMNV